MILRLTAFTLAAVGCVALSQESRPAATQPDTSTPVARPAHSRIRLGGFDVSAAYSRSLGAFPYFGYYPGYWYYDPLFFTPVYALGYFTGFAYGPNLGGVKIHGAEKDTWVYLNGALAGRAGKLKEMWLDPGAYNLELRSEDRRLTQKVYVLSGKTLTVTPDLMEARP